MALATVAGLAINLVGINPIRALYVTAIINGLVAPPLMVLIVVLGSTRAVMGRRTSGPVSKSLTWIATAVVGAAALALVVTQLV